MKLSTKNQLRKADGEIYSRKIEKIYHNDNESAGLWTLINSVQDQRYHWRWGEDVGLVEPAPVLREGTDPHCLLVYQGREVLADLLGVGRGHQVRTLGWPACSARGGWSATVWPSCTVTCPWLIHRPVEHFDCLHATRWRCSELRWAGVLLFCRRRSTPYEQSSSWPYVISQSHLKLGKSAIASAPNIKS